MHFQVIALSDQAGWSTGFGDGVCTTTLATSCTDTGDLFRIVVSSKQGEDTRLSAAFISNGGQPQVSRRRHYGRMDNSCPGPDVDRGRSSWSVKSKRGKGRMLMYEKPKASYFAQCSYDRKFWHRRKSPFLDPLVSKIVTVLWSIVAGLPMTSMRVVCVAVNLIKDRGWQTR
jgi:hypothetical protein